MVTMDKLYKEQYVLILWRRVFKWITKDGSPPQFVSHNLHDFNDMLTSELLVELSPKREADLKVELTPQAKHPNKVLY